MSTMKLLIFKPILILFSAMPIMAQAQNGMDFQKMKEMFEQRRPQLDSMKSSPKDFELPFISIETKTSDSINIVSWFIPNQQKKGTIILVHGFDMNKSGMLKRALFFYQLGYSVLMPDLRARGESGGNKANTGANNATDIESIYLLYKNHLSQYGKVTFYGYSHGGRAILFGMQKLAAKEDVILESTPYYLMKGFQRQYKIQMPMKVDESALQQAMESIAKNRVLLLVGDRDTAINEEEAIDLIQYSSNENSQMILFENTGHSIFDSQKKPQLKNKIEQFLNTKN